jgi:putative thiamine transport system permease protein
LLLGLAVAAAAVALSVGCLEYERRRGRFAGAGTMWLLYLPLLLPQVSFLFGAQVWLLALGISGGWVAVAWSHLLFVLPYVFLCVADPYRAHDPRYDRVARCLGAPPLAAWWRVRLPMLLRPLLYAGAVGFAVGAAQYLPTLVAAGGRVSTLVTEAVALSSGADRRAVAAHALILSVLPLAAFALALALPAWAFRHRRGLRVAP